MRPFVSGLVLAAGTSSRLGQPKQLLPYRGTTLLGWVLSRVHAATALDEVIVVVGAATEEIRARVDFRGARVVENADFAEGCGASYRTGLSAVDSRAAAVAVLLGDQPGIDPAAISRVVDAWRQSRDRLVAADYRGRLGHPLVFSRALFDQLGALRGDKAAWKLLDADAAAVRRVPVDADAPTDVNTRDDWDAALRAGSSGA